NSDAIIGVASQMQPSVFTQPVFDRADAFLMAYRVLSHRLGPLVHPGKQRGARKTHHLPQLFEHRRQQRAIVRRSAHKTSQQDSVLGRSEREFRSHESNSDQTAPLSPRDQESESLRRLRKTARLESQSDHRGGGVADTGEAF